MSPSDFDSINRSVHNFLVDLIAKGKAKLDIEWPPKSTEIWQKVAQTVANFLATPCFLDYKVEIVASKSKKIDWMHLNTYTIAPSVIKNISEVRIYRAFLECNENCQQLPLEELVAAFAHEFGHLANNDARGTRVFLQTLNKINYRPMTKLRRNIVIYAEHRAREFRADSEVLEYRIGKPLVAFLKRLQEEKNKIKQDRNMPTLFSSHPLLEERIARLEEEIYRRDPHYFI